MLDINKNYSINQFSTDEVNSGSCSSDTINIWRKEEILKVTIHECIHLQEIHNQTPSARNAINLNMLPAHLN